MKLSKVQKSLCMALVIAAAGAGLAVAQAAQQSPLTNTTVTIPQDQQVMDMLTAKK